MAVCVAEITLAARTPEGLRIAAVFKQLREMSGLTQEQVAERAGLTLAGYRPYEQGKRQMRTEQIAVFAEAFGVPRTMLAERLHLADPDVGDASVRQQLAEFMPDADAAELDLMARQLGTLPPSERRQILEMWRDHLNGRLSRLGRA